MASNNPKDIYADRKSVEFSVIVKIPDDVSYESIAEGDKQTLVEELARLNMHGHIKHIMLDFPENARNVVSANTGSLNNVLENVLPNIKDEYSDPSVITGLQRVFENPENENIVILTDKHIDLSEKDSKYNHIQSATVVQILYKLDGYSASDMKNTNNAGNIDNYFKKACGNPLIRMVKFLQRLRFDDYADWNNTTNKETKETRCHTFLETSFSTGKYEYIKDYLTNKHGHISKSKGMKYTGIIEEMKNTLSKTQNIRGSEKEKEKEIEIEKQISARIFTNNRLSKIEQNTRGFYINITEKTDEPEPDAYNKVNIIITDPNQKLVAHLVAAETEDKLSSDQEKYLKGERDRRPTGKPKKGRTNKTRYNQVHKFENNKRTKKAGRSSGAEGDLGESPRSRRTTKQKLKNTVKKTVGYTASKLTSGIHKIRRGIRKVLRGKSKKQQQPGSRGRGSMLVEA
jgi:hypothetical protein